MAGRFFDPESPAFKPFGWAGEIVILSLLWGICCLPVVTAGSATTALYDTVVHALRRRDDELFRRFFGTFRRELVSGICSTLLWAAVSLLAFLLYQGFRSVFVPGPLRNTALTLYHLLVPFFLLCILCWVFPLLSRFTFGTAALNLTALRLGLGHILRSVALGLVTGGAALVCYLFTSPIIFLPALVALFWSWLMEPVFKSYE